MTFYHQIAGVEIGEVWTLMKVVGVSYMLFPFLVEHLNQRRRGREKRLRREEIERRTSNRRRGKN